jgi:SAM-dependent methyltransferase
LKQKDIVAYYDHVYYGRGKEFYRTLNDYRVFLDHLRPERGSRLLDVGCGRGLLVRASDAYYGCIPYGIDISKTAIAEARKNYSRPQAFQLASGEALPYINGAFDYVTSMGSLEHYLRPELGWTEIVRVCKPGGKILAVLPNYYFSLNIIHVLAKGDHYMGHHQIIERVDTRKGWLRFLTREDVVVEGTFQDRGARVRVCSGGIGPARLLRRLLKRLLLLATPLNLTYQFVFICRKKRKPIS